MQFTQTISGSLLVALAGSSLLFFTAPPAIANDAINEIIVTAKNDQSVSDTLVTSHLFTADDLDLIQAKDVTTLLQQVPGINIADSGGRGTTTGVFLRGASAGQTIVLIDGVRVGSATLGSAALNSFPIESINRVEVVKGPLAGIYGADAVGGVIQLFTNAPSTQESGISGSVSAAVGSDDLQELGFSLKGGNSRNNFYVSAQSEDTDGIDRTSITTGGNDDIDGFEQTSFSLGGRVSFSDRTYAQLTVLTSDNTVEFDNTFGDDPGSFTETETFSSAISVVSQLSDRLEWKTTVGFNEDDSVTTASFNSEFSTERTSLASELSLELSDTAQLIAGIDYYDEEVSPADTFPVTDRDNKGVFALYKNQWGKFSLLGNLRYDDNSAYGSDTNGSLSLEYDLSDSVSAVASYGTAFSAPSFNFLFFPFFGNPDLLPEESESIELSLRGKSSNLNWRLSAYKTDIENLFSFDPATFLAANIGSAELEGIEAEISTELADWQLSAAANVMSADDLDSGTELDDRAQKTLSLTAARSWENFDIRLSMLAESDRFDNRGTELASFGLFDASARYRVSDSISVHAAVNNVFDKDYTVNLIGANDRFRTEGRQARISLRYQF